MAKRQRDLGAQKLLESWEAPREAGEPVGCIATTFTFDSAFLEEHCLSRFLRLETDPREDGAAYLIEREEKLATATVTVLVDRSTAQGSQSARWDVLPVTVPGGIQHGKVAVLAWEHLVRVLIASANLTEPAYRMNQEVAGVLDFRNGGEVPLEALTQTLGFVRGLATLAPGSDTAAGPKMRLGQLLARLEGIAGRWTAQPPKKGWESPRAVLLFVGPMPGYQQPVPERLGQVVRERGGPATQAWVLSPFFDAGEAPGSYPATTALVGALTDRGERTVGFLVVEEPLPDGRRRLRAPRSILRSARKTAAFEVYPVPEDVDGEHRPLHAKSLWLWNDRWHVYMIGSSNFTSAGLALPGRAPNVEANLVYVFPEDGAIVRAMEQSLPAYGEPVRNLDEALWEVATEEDEDGAGRRPILPAGFEEALFTPDPVGGTLELQIGSRGLPAEWEVLVPGGSGDAADVVLESREWRQAGSPGKIDRAWRRGRTPTVLDVRWRGPAGEALAAAWPVNVTDLNRLPPPEDLRHLSLDTLVEILGSARPLYEAVLAAKRKELVATTSPDELDAAIDPHRRVRTETFLLQRTRRVARAIEQLLLRLGRPVAHREVLAWRLRGPVGPLALARALAEGARSPGEAVFLLADLTLALGRLDVRAMATGMAEDEVRRELTAVRGEIETLATARLADEAAVPPTMREYVTRAFEEARR
jgi:hypothetical protein